MLLFSLSLVNDTARVELHDVGDPQVVERRTGVMKLSDWQVAPSTPIFNEPWGIVMKTFGVTDVLRETLPTYSGDVYGYRFENPYLVFQVLEQTLGLGPEIWRVLAKASPSAVSRPSTPISPNERNPVRRQSQIHR